MSHSLHGSYNVILAILSYIIAVIASYCALDLAGRVTSAQGQVRRLWLLFGASAMGIGIWSMHFVAMLAYELPIAVSYNIPLVVFSMIAAIAASYLALQTSSAPVLRMKQLLLSGLLMGAGVLTMHYSGMAALRLQAEITYDPVLVAASVVIAIAASLAALGLAFYFRSRSTAAGNVLKLLAGMVMGAAIAGMHYTGMAATAFVPLTNTHEHELLALDLDLIAGGVVASTFAILGIALLGSFMDRRISHFSRLHATSEEQYLSLFQHNSDGVLRINPEGRIISCNPAVSQITGYSAEEICGNALLDLAGVPDKELLETQFAHALSGQDARYELPVLHRDGQELLLSVRSVPIFVDGCVTGVYGIFQDITETKKTEARMHELAYCDDLTRLPNRRAFMQRLKEWAGNANRSGAEHATVLLLDIDRFKLINDSIGSTFGDDLLRQMAERLQTAVQDWGLAARVGSDEFAVFSTKLEGRMTLGAAQKLAAIVEEPFTVGWRQFAVTVSIGAAAADESLREMDVLWQRAETALLQSKRQGSGGFQMYTEDMDAAAKERLELENDLRLALERDEFILFYQPQWDTQRGTLIGAEALLRWKHPKRGMVPPVQFIPVAEASGLINPIGEWVLKEACRQNKQWQESGLPPIRISVNLSIRQFEQPDLVDRVAQVLQSVQLEPAFIELEITESMAMDAERAIITLSSLKRLGVHISMDDFGTGYSSLSVLRRFPIDKLKIDRSFVRDFGDNQSNALIASTIIGMAHSLNLSVIAEGVETLEQVEFLRTLACYQVQGYYYSPPLPAEDFRTKFLKAI
ncbi:EAL domain-containing protein [Paenibacillus chartarius]|uniref:EAL domain-containing protein n=1 Tax=Paenibacillus chartarius TaxID=747481 RepID=A0ABV6DV43_9BACL